MSGSSAGNSTNASSTSQPPLKFEYLPGIWFYMGRATARHNQISRYYIEQRSIFPIFTCWKSVFIWGAHYPAWLDDERTETTPLWPPVVLPGWRPAVRWAVFIYCCWWTWYVGTCEGGLVDEVMRTNPKPRLLSEGWQALVVDRTLGARFPPGNSLFAASTQLALILILSQRWKLQFAAGHSSFWFLWQCLTDSDAPRHSLLVGVDGKN